MPRAPNTHSIRLPSLLYSAVTETSPQKPFKLAPSILSADFARLGEQLRAAEAAGADLIHVDVMDGHFVPNITLGPLVVEACRRSTKLPLDVHLMITEPERYVETFAAAGADGITVHAEATVHLHSTLQLVRTSGAKVGLAVNPLTPLNLVEEALPYLDLVLVMSVNPGFGGQTFIEGSFERLRRVAAWKRDLKPECGLEVDGGVSALNIARVLDAGAEIVVAGSAVYTPHDKVAENIQTLRVAARAATEADR